MRPRHILTVPSIGATLWYFSLLLLVIDLFLAAGCGVYWMYEQGWLVWAMAVGLGCTMFAYLFAWLWARKHLVVPKLEVESEEYWSNCEKQAFEKVEQCVAAIPYEEGDSLNANKYLEYVHTIAHEVASVYRPNREKPEYDVPLAHVMVIAERVVRDLRQKIAEEIPGTYLVTLNHLFYLQSWYGMYPKLYQAYRLVAFPLNPVSGVMREARLRMGREIFNSYQHQLGEMLFRYSLNLVGRYAVELYSGRLRFEDLKEKRPELAHPAEVLLVGQSGVGKTTFQNDFFGEATAERFHVTELEGFERGVKTGRIFRREQETTPFEKCRDAMLQSELVILVYDALREHTADVAFVRDFMAWKKEHPERTPPILLVAAILEEVTPEEVERVCATLSLDEETPVFPVEYARNTETQREIFQGMLEELSSEILRVQEARGIFCCRKSHGVSETGRQLGMLGRKVISHLWGGKKGEK
ncbi:MAG: GTPase domain-containing protein [Planctomycetia bacterium]|nr:GTPase domain-containing protein [Planctomycetia bacterium]